MASILIVEDEPSVSENIAYALSTEGFAPLCCATAGAALKLMRENAVVLAILDVGLPDRSGFDLCKEIRRTSDVPVIFLTARGGEVDRVVGLEIGADDYMVKPFSPRELTARVKAILKRCDPARSSTRAGPTPFLVDEEKRTIRYFDTTLSLTRYEFRLLVALVRRPGRVFDRETLMAQAWDEPEASMDRTVDAHIKSLRAKLKAVKPEVEAIVTHRGMGYSLKEDW
ncbi:MAG: two-component system response regulator CreB [Lentisphaerota bacterium]